MDYNVAWYSNIFISRSFHHNHSTTHFFTSNLFLRCFLKRQRLMVNYRISGVRLHFYLSLEGV